MTDHTGTRPAGTLPTVAVVGLGRMGQPMARHISEAGFEVACFDVADDARRRADDIGLTVADSLADLAAADVICTSLPATAEVEAVYLGGDEGGPGLIDILHPGAVCADLSTISVTGSRAIAARCVTAGIAFVDAPVSGTSIHAEAGTLVVMAGGEVTAVERVSPVLGCFATTVERVGDNGAGLELKLVTNRLLTTHLAAIAEAIVTLEHTDLSVDQAIVLLRAGAVPRLLDYKAGPMAERDYSPQFTVDLMLKDLRLAEADLPEPALATAARLLVETASEAGLGAKDLGAIMDIIEDRFPGR